MLYRARRACHSGCGRFIWVGTNANTYVRLGTCVTIAPSRVPESTQRLANSNFRRPATPQHLFLEAPLKVTRWRDENFSRSRMACRPYHHYKHADDRDRPDTVKIILHGQVPRLSRYGREHPKNAQASAKFKHAFEARIASGAHFVFSAGGHDQKTRDCVLFRFSQTSQQYPVAVDALASNRPFTIGTRSVNCANLVGGVTLKIRE